MAHGHWLKDYIGPHSGGSGGGKNVPTLYISGSQYSDLSFDATIVSGNVNDFVEALSEGRAFDVHIAVRFYSNGHDSQVTDVLHVAQISSGSVGDFTIRAYRIFQDGSVSSALSPYTITVDMDGNLTIEAAQ